VFDINELRRLLPGQVFAKLTGEQRTVLAWYHLDEVVVEACKKISEYFTNKDPEAEYKAELEIEELYTKLKQIFKQSIK